MNNELVKMSFKQEKTKVTKSAVAVILDCAIVIPISDLDVSDFLKCTKCIKSLNWTYKQARQILNITVTGIATRKNDDVDDVKTATKIAAAKAYRTAYKECKNICKELKNAYASIAVTFIESQKRFNNLAIHQDADIYNLVSTMDNNNKADGEK
jgi:hypothetical protein